MPKWIDLKVRQPKHGQLVVIKGAPYQTFGFDLAVNTDVSICKFGTYSPEDPQFYLEKNATHWYPLPAIREEPNPEREKLRDEYPNIFNQCKAIEVTLHGRAPLIDWRVMPDTLHSGLPTGFAYAWKITGSVEVNGKLLKSEETVIDEVMYSARLDWYDRAIRFIANGLAQEILK